MAVSVMASRGAVAALLCGGSLVVLGLLISFPSTADGPKSAALAAIPILWVAGALALTPFGREERLATIASLLYAHSDIRVSVGFVARAAAPALLAVALVRNRPVPPP